MRILRKHFRVTIVAMMALSAPLSAHAQESSDPFQFLTVGLTRRAATGTGPSASTCGVGDQCGDSGCGVACGEQACDLWTRPALTGDWNGCRPYLKKAGFQFRGNVTQFAFGVAGGVKGPTGPLLEQGDTFKYTGRGEYDFLFDLDQFGGPANGKMLVGLQHWWGQYGNVTLNTGTFVPAVFAAALPPAPNDPGTPHLTDFLFTQPLSPGCIVFAGKKNVVGAADQDIFAGGDGTNQFVNQALVANPAYLAALPYSAFTAGILMPRSWGNVSVYVYDPRDRTVDGLDFEGLFDDGIIVGAQVKVPTNFFGKPGEHHVGGIWKHVDLPELGAAPPPPVYPPPPVNVALPTLSDSYTIYYGFDQYLKVYSDEPQRGWGLFGRASVSDGNPTPQRFFISGGIGGDSPLGNHRGDTFGVGWYYIDTSDEYGPFAELSFGPRDGAGVELYYNFQATPWLNITPDVQILSPGLERLAPDTTFVYGLRVNVTL